MAEHEQWVFAGARIGTNDKRVSAWYQPDGKVRLYADRKAARYVIGAVYDCEVTRADGHVTLHGEPVFASTPGDGSAEAVDEELATRWAADDRIAKTKLAALSRERNARKRDLLDAAILPLLTVARNYRQQSDQDALLAYVARQLHAAWALDVKGGERA
jgi:hypothetical protein